MVATILPFLLQVAVFVAAFTLERVVEGNITSSYSTVIPFFDSVSCVKPYCSDVTGRINEEIGSLINTMRATILKKNFR